MTSLHLWNHTFEKHTKLYCSQVQRKGPFFCPLRSKFKESFWPTILKKVSAGLHILSICIVLYLVLINPVRFFCLPPCVSFSMGHTSSQHTDDSCLIWHWPYKPFKVKEHWNFSNHQLTNMERKCCVVTSWEVPFYLLVEQSQWRGCGANCWE